MPKKVQVQQKRRGATECPRFTPQTNLCACMFVIQSILPLRKNLPGPKCKANNHYLAHILFNTFIISDDTAMCA